MKSKNWILEKHKENIKVVSDSYLPFYKDFVMSHGIEVNSDFSKATSFINWNLYPNTFEFFYDFEGCEKEVEFALLNSNLAEAKYVVMDFGYDEPVIQIEAKYFINHWYDFINGAHFESTVVVDDGKFFFEFMKRYKLKSNFKVAR